MALRGSHAIAAAASAQAGRWPGMAVASANPSLRSKIASMGAVQVGTLSSSCSQGGVWTSRKPRRQQAVPCRVETHGGQDAGCEVDTASECHPQVIVPSVGSTDGVLCGESNCREAEPGERAEPETYPETDEGSKDSWLSDFQRHLPSEADEIGETWKRPSDYTGLSHYTSRRRVLGAPLVMSLLLAFGSSLPAKSAEALIPANIDITKVPKTSQFDANDSRLRDAASIIGRALEAPTVEEEESLWTQVIDTYGGVDAEWVPDILARAFGNRGNARSRQGQLELALGDYGRSIELAPYAVDPVLNRGVALESLGRLEEATADYEAVLYVQPDDPAAWNNLGNVKAALRQWDAALRNYSRAVQLAPKFSFAAANYALALYQVGRENEAIRQFRNLLRRYPEFADVRAALAVSLYEQGLYGEAETNWGRLEDGRYADRNWVRNTRRWPPRLTDALEDFLDVKQSESPHQQPVSV